MRLLWQLCAAVTLYGTAQRSGCCGNDSTLGELSELWNLWSGPAFESSQHTQTCRCSRPQVDDSALYLHL